MTTLKIAFYKNIKSVLVLVNLHFLILGGKRGGGIYCLERIFFTTNNFFSTKTLMMMMLMKMSVMFELFNSEQILRMS